MHKIHAHHTYIHTYTYINKHTHTHTHLHTHTHTHTYTHTNTHRHIHTRTHTYTHTVSPSMRLNHSKSNPTTPISLTYLEVVKHVQIVEEVVRPSHRRCRQMSQQGFVFAQKCTVGVHSVGLEKLHELFQK
jgi:hypothetical protein